MVSCSALLRICSPPSWPCRVLECESCYAFLPSADGQNVSDCRSYGTYILLPTLPGRGFGDRNTGPARTVRVRPSGFFLEVFDRHEEDSPGRNQKIEHKHGSLYGRQ